MSSETFLLKPKLDPAALKKADTQLKKLFDPTQKVIKETTTAVRGFQSSFAKVDKLSKSTVKSAKDGLKVRKAAQAEAEKMATALRKAEKHMSAGSAELKQMKREYGRVLATVHEIGRATEKRIRSEQAAARSEARRARMRSFAGRVGGGVRSGAQSAVAGTARVGAGIAAAGLAAGVGALALIEKTRAAADATAKNGTLAVREYGRLAHAAELSGTSIESVTQSSAKLNLLLSRKPSEDFKGALGDIGVDIDKLRAAKPEQQLEMIADGMQGLGSDAERTGVAMRLFGQSGRKLTPLLRGGGSAIRAMGDDAERLGLVFDEVASGAAERLGDAQVRIKSSISGIAQEIISGFLPDLAAAGEGAVAWIMDNREAVMSWVRDVVASLVETGQAAYEWATGVDWANVWEQIKSVGDVIATAIDLILEMTQALGGAETAVLAIGIAAASSFGPLGAVAVAGAAAGYKIGEAMHRAKNEIVGLTVEMGVLANRARTIQQIAGLQAAFEEADAPDKAAEAQAARNAELAGKADRAGNRARAAARKIYGKKIPRDVQAQIAQMERIISTGSASDASKRAAMATLNNLESRATSRAHSRSGGDGKKGKREISAASAAVESDIKSFAETAGKGAYARAIQAGKSEREANKAALAEQKRVAKDLRARSPELIKAGTLGQGTSALAGTPLTAGGALPIALDLGSKGGPPPVQIVNAPATITIEFPDATFDATMEDFTPMIEPALRSALDDMWGRLLPNYSTGPVR